MARVVLTLLFVIANSQSLSDGMLGTWTPTVIPKSILGPVRILRHFTAAKGRKDGDFWFSLIPGQIFRVSGKNMQYCFSEPGLLVSEQAPFYVDSADDKQVTFCWRGKRMPIHKAGCEACDCAKITIELKTPDALHFTFWQSPPVIHAHVELKKTGPPPPVAYYQPFLLGKLCVFMNHTGLLPFGGKGADGPDMDGPDSQNEVSRLETPVWRPSCPVSSTISGGDAPASPHFPGIGGGTCRRLDGYNWMIDREHVPDIRLQHSHAGLSCWPCDVHYSISANINENQYIAVGFRGMGYQVMFDAKRDRPNYFGMNVDDGDDDRTTKAIALGYGSCFREMRANDYVGAPVDVDRYHSLLKKTSVSREGGRTILRFTVSQHVGLLKPQMVNFFANPIQASERIMWAIGTVGSPPSPPTPPTPSTVYECSVCSNLYDPSQHGGVAFEDLPDTWVCPVCGAPKSKFAPIKQLSAMAGQPNTEACREVLNSHGDLRGVAPLNWLSGGSSGCIFKNEELYGSYDSGVISI